MNANAKKDSIGPACMHTTKDTVHSLNSAFIPTFRILRLTQRRGSINSAPRKWVHEAKRVSRVESIYSGLHTFCIG